VETAFEIWGGYLAFGIGGTLAIAFTVIHAMHSRHIKLPAQEKDYRHTEAA
jgi:predicted outer membrane lipoprotein